MNILVGSGNCNGNEKFLCSPAGGKVRMTREQFAQWMAKADSNGDGNISRAELRRALKSLGLGHAWFRAWMAMDKADLNDNNVIDSDLEVMILIKFAAKHWGIIVTDDE